jgi:tetratricopeptide (TPR) repeat protein
MYRLRALVRERDNDMQEAHEWWQEFERSVAERPTVWPGEVGTRVRALIWQRMGRNAASVPDQEKIDQLPPFLRDHPARPQPLTPSAEACFQRSLQLAPDQLETHEALFHHYRQEEKDAKAEKAARQLLQHFPDHVATVEELADLRSHQGDHAEAVSLLQHAVKVNPLDRSLQAKLATAHLFNARDHVEAGHFDEARAEYQTTLHLGAGLDESPVYCKWSACEFKAGEAARAEELLEKALAESDNRLAVAFSMLIEAIRLKLPRTLKTRFDRDFNAGLQEPPTGSSASAIAITAGTHRAAGITYHGQKTHEKKVLTYLDKAWHAEFTERQLRGTCGALLNLEAHKLLRRFAGLGKRKFPSNPYFYCFEAESYISQGPYRCPAWKVQPLLEKARKLAQQLPPDDELKAFLELLDQRQQMIGAHGFLNGPEGMGMLEEMFRTFGDLGDFEDDDDYEEVDF